MRSLVYHSLKRIASFAGPAFIDQLIVSGTNFAVALYLSHALGISAFGQFSIILLLLFFCLECQRALIIAPMTNFLAKDREQSLKPIASLALVVALLISILIATLIGVTSFLIPKWNIGTFFLPAGCLIFFRLAYEFVRRVLFIELKTVALIKFDLCCTIFLVLGLYILRHQNILNVVSVIWLQSVIYFMAACCSAYSLPNHFGLACNWFVLVKPYWRYGSWLFASVIATYASSNYILLTGAGMIGSSATGIMKTAQYMMGGMIILFQAMENILPYHLNRAIEVASSGLKKAFLKILSGMMIFCMCYAILIIFFMNPLIHWLNLGNLPEVHFIIFANIIISFILVLNTCMQYLWRALAWTKPIFMASLSTACCSVLVSQFLIHHYQLLGIIYGLLGFQLITLVIYSLSFLYYKRVEQ